MIKIFDLVKLGNPNGNLDYCLCMRFEASPSKNVNNCGVRQKVVVTEGFGLSPVKEAKGEVGIVPNLEGNFRKFSGCEP